LLGVIESADLMIITKNGLTIRLPIADLRVMGRATQGVKLINLRKGDEIAAVEFVPAGDKEDEIAEGINPEIESNENIDVESTE
jgi:DNA gyrase subunit A